MAWIQSFPTDEKSLVDGQGKKELRLRPGLLMKQTLAEYTIDRSLPLFERNEDHYTGSLGACRKRMFYAP
jgi:hypothetical protein